MESQSSKGDPSRSPVSGGGKGDPSKSPISDGGKGDPSKAAMPTRVPIQRPPEHATKGRPVKLLANHFKVSLKRTDQMLHHYDVIIMKYDGDQPVLGKDGHKLALGEAVCRKVLKQLYETYASELAHKVFAYDGEKGLFTVGPLPFNNNVFPVVLGDASSGKIGTSRSPGGDGSPGTSDKKRMKREVRATTFKVEIVSVARVPMSAIAQVLRGGQESESSQEAIRVLNIILRQHSARQGYLLVRHSFFHGDFGSIELGGGVTGCRGFHSSFRPTQNGLSLNFDLSTTMVVRPGPVIDFLLSNQNVKDLSKIDLRKAKRALNKLRIKTTHTNMEFTIAGLSEYNCNKQTFPLKQKDGSTMDVTVYDYFLDHWSIKLNNSSANFPCLNAGKPNRPTYLPLELCHLLPLQRYKKSLSTLQRSKLVEGSRQKPLDRMSSLSRALRDNNYDSEPMLRECGISIAREFMQVEGRVLQAPQLKAGNGEDIFTRNGRWNFNNKRLIKASVVEKWAVVNFSARCNCNDLVRDLIKCGAMKGIKVEPPHSVFEEKGNMSRSPAPRRVEDMFEQVKTLPGPPMFLLCVLAERKNSDIYGPWKRKCLADFGIVTQCVAPTRVNDQYLTNVLLKINAKLGGMNSLLQIETSPATPLVSKVSRMILGMDVSHGSPGQSDVPSIAAVVSSREWPLVSKYRASVRSQSPKLEMIDSLFKPQEKDYDGGKDDDGIIRECLMDFYKSSGHRKPDQIIIFRDGVSESQFNQVLNIELDQIIEACKFFDETWEPKFTLIVAQKNHHTKFFMPGVPHNVPPGTVVDNTVCHPRNYDFYMCAHAGMIGTTRPTHYHILHDEIHFTPDDLQDLVHSLSYVYQRSTTAISVVAPIYYAHLAAAQVAQFIKFDEMSETSSSQGGGHTSAGSALVQELPRLHEKVRNTMFFC